MPKPRSTGKWKSRMTYPHGRNVWRVSALLAGLAVSGCSGTNIDFGSMFGGSGGPAGVDAPASLDRPKPNSQGVIKYPTYAVVVARDADTLETVGKRVDVDPKTLSKLNGLPENYKLRTGEVLVLPKGAKLGEGEEWSPGLVENALERSPQSNAPANLAKSGDPLRHTVEAGETAYSIARLYGVSVTSLASWNGLDANLSVTPGRTLIVPVSAPVADRPTINDPGKASAVTAPPSAKAPLPKNVDVASLPDSPNLAKDRTPVGVQRKLALPVEGKIVKGFSLARGSAKNEGVDFQTKAGAVVSAAEAGEVALVSPSLDRDGKILLIRHVDELITVYTDIDGITVKKGDKVKRGQKVGVVASASKPRLHFEVRRGVEPVDPEIYLKAR